MLNLADAMASGLVILIALIIAVLSFGIRKYALEKVENGSRAALFFFSDETLEKIFKVWSYFNRVVFAIFFFCVVFAGMRFINPPTPPTPQGLVSKAEQIEQRKKTPPPIVEVKKEQTLDQATFFYCLDKASTKKDGLSADVITACKDASLHTVNPKPIEKMVGYT